MLIAPVPPPYGGMAFQAELLRSFLCRDGMEVSVFPSNFPVSRRLRFFDRIPGVRTVLRALLIWPRLWASMKAVEVVQVLAASWLYFFLVVCPAIVVARMRGKRIVLNYRGGGAGEFFDRFGWALGVFFRSASVVTAPSGFLANVIREHFRVPVEIVPNILDLGVFQHKQRTAVEPRLLATRHLEKIYDVESVLRAFQIVQTRFPAASLWIAGSGSQEQYLRNLAADLQLNHVRFLGQVAHEDLPAIYEQRDIFLNASRVDNFPGALLEASAAGLPVVTTGAGGIPFLYEHGKTALLREPGDWRGLAACVEELLLSPALATKLSLEGMSLARQFEWARVRSSIYGAYGMASQEVAARVASTV